MAIDPVARGLGARALAAPRTKVLAAGGRSGFMFGAGNSSYETLGTATIAGGVIEGGATIRVSGQFAKYSPNNGGWAMRVRFKQGATAVVVAQSAGVAATIANFPFDAEFVMSWDRRWMFTRSSNINVFAQASLAAGTYSLDMPSTSAPAAKSPRAKTTGAAFASYSSPPTVETVLIDFSQDFTIEIQAAAVTDDCVELLGFRVTQTAPAVVGNVNSTKSTICAGDSITEGSGSTSGNDWVSRFGKLRTKRPIINEGLGGQTITQIVDRLVVDPTACRYWDMVIFAGVNDASADGAAWWATVHTQLERLIAHRSADARLIICNLYPSTAWSAGTVTAMEYVNTQLAATYGSRVCDLYSVMTSGGVTQAGLLSDDIHPNDAGHLVIAQEVDATATALGWAV